MATLQFSVWKSATQVADGPKLNEGAITISGTSTPSGDVMDPSAANPNESRRVRVMADAKCWVQWNSDPTALNDGTGGTMVGSENPEYFWMKANDKIAVISRA